MSATITKRWLKECILEVVKVHEQSWNAADRKYGLDIGNAAKQVCREFWYPIYLLLESDWNDILEWANAPGDEDGKFIATQN